MIDNDALAAILQEEERLATSFRDTELAEEQETALDYYEAKPFGDEEDGRSQMVTPDVAEVVDYMTVSVLRTCVSGDRVVEFEANEEEQVEAASEATEAISYAFMRQQDGYKVLTDWLQCGLIEKIGVVKTAVVEEKKKRRERVEVSEDELAYLMDSPTPPVAVSEYEPDETGQGRRFTAEIETTTERKRYIDMPIPSEEFIFSARCRDVDDLGYKAHRVRKTISELVDMGFERATVEDLPAEDRAHSLDARATARWDDEGVESATQIPGMRRVWLLEEYVNIDLNDDGIAELVQVFRVGNVILAMEEVEENPFVVFCPFPRAHRMVGNSLADKVMDIQRVRSVVLRQTLDGIYITNNPRMWLPQECITDETIDDLLTVRPGGIVRGKGAGGKPEPLYEPFDIQRGMSMLEYMTGERESRTGITRMNQGIDADTLNKTATGTALMQAQGQQMEEYIARNFAEAMARLFMKKLRLMVDNGDPIAIKVEGSFKQVDPKNWTPDMDVSIRVGLGSGRKEQRLAYRTQLLQAQREGMMGGMVEPIHIYRNIAGIIRDAALGNPNDYWLDPESDEAQAKAQEPQQPSPEEQAAMAKQQEAQASLALEREKAEAQISLEREKMQMQAELAREKAQAEYDLAIAKMNVEAEIAATRNDNMPSYRPGGDLAA